MLEMVVQEEPEEEVVKEEPMDPMVVQEFKEILAIAEQMEVKQEDLPELPEVCRLEMEELQERQLMVSITF
jgi:hypothetical protein